MANNGAFAEVFSADIPQQIDTILAGLKNIRTEQDKINSRKISLPSEGRSNANNTAAVNSTINKTMTEQQRLIMRISDAQKREAIETAKLRIELSNLNAENKKAAIEGLGLMNTYQKLSAELNTVRLEAKGLAADMFQLEQAGEQNSDQYRELAATYAQVSARSNLLNTGLNNIDANLGQYQRNVGNYASGWNGLGNAINQLTREAPAFAVSLSTGFLAISNNIPTLVDELSRLNTENDRLRAQGEPTRSVLSQLASSLFSWQTLLSVGVTLLTLYGSKLIDWAFSAKKATGEIDQLRAATERYQDTIVEITTNSERELTTMQRLLTVAQDVTKSTDERTQAAKQLIDQYPGYLKGLTAEQIMLGNNGKASDAYRKSITQLTTDIQKRVDAEAKQDKSRETLKIAAELEQEVAVRRRANDEVVRANSLYGAESGQAKATLKDIQERIKARKKQTDEDATFIAKFGKIGIDDTGSVSRISLYTEAQITSIALQAQALRQAVADEKKEIDKAFADTSLLDYKPDTANTDKTKAFIELEDYLAAEYESNKLRIEYNADADQRIYENTEISFEKRDAAARDYIQTQSELANNALAEQLRLIEKERIEKLASYAQELKDKKITENQKNAEVYALNRKLAADQVIAYENYNEALTQIDVKRLEILKGVYNQINFQKAQNEIDKISLENAEKYSKVLQNAVKTGANYREVLKATKELEAGNNDIAVRNAQLRVDELEKEIRGIADVSENTQKRTELIGQLTKAQETLTNATNKQLEVEYTKIEKLQKATEAYLETFQSNALQEFGFSSLNTFLKIEENGKTTFQNLLAGATTTAQKIGVAFNAMTSVVQEAFTFLNQNRQLALDNELANEIKIFEIRKKYAGDSTEAQADLERQLEDKKRDIRIREAKAAKEAALFNIAVNTAQGVVAALATIPPNIPLSIAIGAIGLAQGIAVASRPLPAYKDGTENHPGGLALVGDGGKNEVVWQPKGGYSITPKTNTIMDLQKGSKVYPDIASSGLLNSGLPIMNVPSKGLTESQMDAIMSKHLGSSSSVNINFDERGYSKFQKKANAKTISHNNRVAFRGNVIRS